MDQRKSMDKIQESFQFGRQMFHHEVTDKYWVIDLPSQTMDWDVFLYSCSLSLATARITAKDGCFFIFFFISFKHRVHQDYKGFSLENSAPFVFYKYTRKLLVSILQNFLV